MTESTLEKRIWDHVEDAPLDLKAMAPHLARGASMELAIAMVHFLAHMEEMKMPVLIYCVYRTGIEQAQMYAQGRTKPGNIITNAGPGQSAHNRESAGQHASDAFDACPLIDARPSWEKTGPAKPVWEEMGHAAQLLGLEWGRNFRSLSGDWAHFQYPRITRK